MSRSLVGSSSTSRLDGCARSWPAAGGCARRPTGRGPAGAPARRGTGSRAGSRRRAAAGPRTSTWSPPSGQRLPGRRVRDRGARGAGRSARSQVGAELHRAGVGCELADQQLEQRGLAGAVGADQADPVAAQDAGREVVARSARSPKLLEIAARPRSPARPTDSACVASMVAGRSGRSAGAAACAARAARAAGPRCACAARVTPRCTSRSRARSGGRACAARPPRARGSARPVLEGVVALVEAAHDAAVEPHRCCATRSVEEAPVVADQHERAAQAGQLAPPAIRWSAGRDGWSARRAAGRRARRSARASAARRVSPPDSAAGVALAGRGRARSSTISAR